MPDAQSQWTLETLRAHIETIMTANDLRYTERFEASQTALSAALLSQKVAVDTALGAADRAVSKAENAAEKRFEAVNEFRNTLSDQQKTFVSRGEAEAAHKSLEEKLTAFQNNYVKRHDELVAEVAALRNQLTLMIGKSSGMSTLWGGVIATGGLLVAIGSIIVALVLK